MCCIETEDTMNIGKQLRINLFYRHDKYHTMIVPLDHGMTMGPIPGIDMIRNMISILSRHSIDGIILHKGLITSCADTLQHLDIPIVMHLSARTNLSSSYKEVLVASVKEAVSYGCSAVSVQINFGHEEEGEMLKDVAQVSKKCYQFGIPLLIMAYASNYSVPIAKHLARISAELGGDFVKLPYTDIGGDFREVIEGCTIPVLIAGGEKATDISHFIQILKYALKIGIGGVSIGRNLFQNKNVDEFLEKLLSIIRNEIR